MENTEKIKILKEALKIIDKLGKLDDDIDIKYIDIDELNDLVKRAKVLKKNHYWRLT
jgi:uncharacterized protein YoxC